MAHGVCYRKTERNKEDREERILFYQSVGAGNGSVMALLLSGITGGTGERGSTDRQTQHAGNDCFFVAGISREADKERSVRRFTYYSGNGDAGNYRLKELYFHVTNGKTEEERSFHLLSGISILLMVANVFDED